MGKKESVKVQNNKFTGSITVELVFLFPVILFAVFSFLSLYRFLEIDEALRFAASKIGEEFTMSGFMSSVSSKSEEKQDTNELIETATEAVQIGVCVLQAVPEGFLEDGWIVGGKAGIQFWDSHIQQKDQVIIWMRYQLYFPVFKNILPKISITRKIVLRSFTGNLTRGEKKEEAKEEAETSVYVTETGTVYHYDKECSYIKLSIKTVEFQEISSKRNLNGSKYTPCERCNAPLRGEGIIFITSYGEHYHISVSCSSLKRTVRTISLEQAQKEGKRACKKCQRGNSE